MTLKLARQMMELKRSTFIREEEIEELSVPRRNGVISLKHSKTSVAEDPCHCAGTNAVLDLYKDHFIDGALINRDFLGLTKNNKWERAKVTGDVPKIVDHGGDPVGVEFTVRPRTKAEKTPKKKAIDLTPTESSTTDSKVRKVPNHSTHLRKMFIRNARQRKTEEVASITT